MSDGGASSPMASMVMTRFSWSACMNKARKKVAKKKKKQRVLN
jgi:hypothetical protein